MANLSQSSIRTQVRQRLDEITISGQEVLLDSNLEDVASSNFSDADLNQRIEFAARNLAALVKAQYLPDLVETVAPARFHDHYPIRLLGSRVKVTSTANGTQRATRRTFQGHRQLEARGITATTLDPVYIYEDHILKVIPDPVDAGSSTTATVDLLRWPGSFHGATISTQNIGVEELDERFENAIIERTLFYCYMTLGNIPLATEAQKKYVNDIGPFLVARITPQQNGDA